MFKHLIFITIFIHSYTVKSIRICASESGCVCSDLHKDNEDYLGDVVDCSHYEEPNIFAAELSLPKVVYSLDLSSNNISVLESSDLLRSNTLQRLFLKNNRLEKITSRVFQLPKLQWLDLSGNRLQFIDKEVFVDLRYLQYLNLADNRFTSHGQLAVHRLSNLNEIILDNNNLGAALEDYNLFDINGFGLTHKISSLGLSGINLNKVRDNFFSSAYDLRELALAYNNISDIFELPYSLEYLDLSDNPITEIASEDFADLPVLKVLKLNNLHIKEVPEYAFNSLHSLVELELERNRNLTVFHPLAFGREVLDDADDFMLERLSLKGSRVTKLSKELLEPMGQLRKLDLQGNPWECDCELVWLKSLQIHPEDYEHLRCGSPKPLFNGKIFELKSRYFTCVTTGSDHRIGLTLAAVAFCGILAAIGVWFFVFIPRYQSRGNCITSVYTPTAAYSILPLHAPDA